MKNIIYPLLLLVLLFNSPLVSAIPPYMGISVGQNLSFTHQSCLSAAKQVLRKDGFKKIVQYKTSATLFAAYRNSNPYHYKALVKCLSESGVIVVVAVANIPKNAKAKAERLRERIQRYKGIQRVQPVEIEEEEEEVEENTFLETPSPKNVPQTVEENTNIAAAEKWQSTTLNRKDCLNRAEKSVRDSGFYQDFDFDDDSVYGKKGNYTGFVQCVTADNLVFFQITGGTSSQVRKQLLGKLQKNF
ncbi:hypothetical protein [Candidatus Parabeggiatoa sp. HSG14]|uniref:hypothetical protein n=1 Tax=Candidatus Parabeggiatoa sp. HSG14 TaxID=3055593 RepID=UPI0025A73E9C|nr:hypothetical protein [Thiotrichales bacterium HSG14]